jgi:hypothetical protein
MPPIHLSLAPVRTCPGRGARHQGLLSWRRLLWYAHAAAALTLATSALTLATTAIVAAALAAAALALATAAL